MNKKQYDQLTDDELLNLYNVDKNLDWIGKLLERYTILLFGVCMKYLKDENEAKDGVQQIFLKVLSDISKYKIEYFKSWLYMVAKNHCLMKLRDKGSKYIKELSDQIIDIKPDIKENNDTEAAYEFLEESINNLSKEQRQCVILFYLKKYSYQQISEHSGYSITQVKSYIQNGKRNLKILIERRLKEIEDGKNE